jgi:hypothetical protein
VSTTPAATVAPTMPPAIFSPGFAAVGVAALAGVTWLGT